MEEAKVEKVLVKRERRFLGVTIRTANKGQNAGNKFGILNLYELKTYDDGSVGYSVPEVLMSFDKAKEIMSLGLAPWTLVKIEFEEMDSFYSKPKIKSLVPLLQ